MRNVVSVSDISKADFFEIAKTLAQREVVGKRLARVFQLTQCVDDRNACVLRHSFNCPVGKSAKDDPVHPALEIVGDVTELFPPVEAPVSLIDKRSPAAHAGHPRFKREPGAEGLLLEKHYHLLAGQCGPKIGGTRFQQSGQMENGLNLNRAEVTDRNQVAARKRRG